MKVTLEFIFYHVFLGRVEEDREWGGVVCTRVELSWEYSRGVIPEELSRVKRQKKKKKNKHVKTGGPVYEQIHFGEYQINLKAV